MVMFFITVVKRIRADTKCQYNHTGFKKTIVNNIDAEQGEAAEKQWQQCAMDGAGQRSPNTQCIPIDPVFHKEQQIYKKATLLQKKRPAIS